MVAAKKNIVALKINKTDGTAVLVDKTTTIFIFLTDYDINIIDMKEKKHLNKVIGYV